MANSFVIGKGTKISVALLKEGDRTAPTPTTLTSQTASTTATSGQATITLASAVGAGVTIAAGSYIGWTNPTTGAQVPTQLVSDVDQGDTTAVVVSIPETIAASSTFAYPLRLKGRTAANLGRTANDVTTIDFDSDAYSDGAVTSVEQTLEVPGNYLPTDAAFLTTEYAFLNLRELYVILELPRPSSTYTAGKKYAGVVSITDLPLEDTADGIITANGTFKFRGRPVETDPTT